MKNYFITILIITIMCIITYYIKGKYYTTNNIVPVINEINQYKEYSFYKENNLQRYNNYKIKYPELSNKDIVLKVNIGLDNPFYTNTKEINKFDIKMIINKYNYVSNDFIPDNLVLVDGYSKENMYLVKECKDAFINMARIAELEGFNIRAISTYRTIDYQKNLFENYVKKDGIKKAETYSARAGYSEHHTGLAIDIDNIKMSYNDFENTEEFNWMQNNAYKYGFILRYPKDSSITGYIYEPWHYRYVGIEIANYIHENNITYEEYYYEFLDKEKK